MWIIIGLSFVLNGVITQSPCMTRQQLVVVSNSNTIIVSLVVGGLKGVTDIKSYHNA